MPGGGTIKAPSPVIILAMEDEGEETQAFIFNVTQYYRNDWEEVYWSFWCHSEICGWFSQVKKIE